MSICIKEEPTIDTTLLQVSIPVHEPDSENFPPQSEPVPFCSLCIRECPERSDFYEFNIESSTNFCHSIKDLLGVELQMQSFNTCQTCWKMVRTIGDFRKSCLRAQHWMERIDEVGLKNADDWSSEGMGQTIDYLQEVIVNHTKRIEQAEPAEAELFTMLSIGPIKIQAYEAEEVVQKEPSLATEADCSEKMLKQVTPSDELLLKVLPKKFVHRKPDKKKFHCRLCDIAFTRIGHLKLHTQRAVHQQRVKILNKLKTAKLSESDCNTETTELITPDDEQLAVKSVEKKYRKTAEKKCEECDIIFKEGQHLRMHKLTIKHQQAVKMYNKEAIAKIAEDINCLQNESYDNDAKEGKEIPKRPTPKQKSPIKRKHKCPTCDAKMASKHSLRIHLKFVHNEARFECDHCGGKFKTKDGLKMHLFMQHVASRDFVCPVCSNCYIDASALQGHLSSHKGYRPFECDQCDRGYHSEKLLDRHVKKCH